MQDTAASRRASGADQVRGEGLPRTPEPVQLLVSQCAGAGTRLENHGASLKHVACCCRIDELKAQVGPHAWQLEAPNRVSSCRLGPGKKQSTQRMRLSRDLAACRTSTAWSVALM